MSDTTTFQPSRADGRSDRQIIFELAQSVAPGTMLSYPELEAALHDGMDTPITRQRIYRAVAAANRSLLREERRSLSPVRNTGYKMLRADEHLPAALVRKDRAEHQMKNGLALLKQVRWEELGETHRALHQGQLLILGSLYQAMQETDKRLKRQDEVLSDIRKRVDRLEGASEAATN